MERPNILFFMTDEQRFDAMGYQNPEVHTPCLDRLAEESVVFDRAYTANPSCIPARAAIFTGRYPSQCGAPCYITPLPAREKTFMSLLQKAGYYTAVIGKQHFWTYAGDRGYDYMDIVDEHAPPREISKELGDDPFGQPALKTVSDTVSSYVAFLADHGFHRDSELTEPISPHGAFRWKAEEKYYVDAYIGDRGAQWLRDHPQDGQPWFLTVSFPGPHMPFDGVGLPDDAAYEGETISLPRTRLNDIWQKPPHYLEWLGHYGQVDAERKTVNDGLDDAEIRLIRRAYYSDMTLIDRKIGVLLDVLRERGEYDRTLIVFVSDHGDFMGDFGMAAKAQYPAEALMRVPMLLKPPVAGFTGYRERSFVSSVELASTFLHAACAPIPTNISQRSLTQFYESGPREFWNHIYMEARDIRAIRDERYKLCYYAGRPYGELYDLRVDPEERVNLWDHPLFQAEKARLTALLLDQMVSLGDNSQIPWNVGAPKI